MPSQIHLKNIRFRAAEAFSSSMLRVKTKDTIDLIFTENLNLLSDLILNLNSQGDYEVSSFKNADLKILQLEINRSVRDDHASLPYPEKGYAFVGRDHVLLNSVNNLAE